VPALLTVTEICERALRKIGAYSINDTGADPVDLEEARAWLDMLVGHVSSRKRTWWLVPSTASVTLVADTASYVLIDELTGSPDVQHVVGVWLVNTSSGDREPLDILRRQAFEDLNADDTGTPCKVWIDRSRAPTLHVWPTPTTPISHRLDVVWQKFSADTRALDATARVTDMRESWNLYLVTALAAEIGAGPVRRLPQDEVKEARARAQELLGDLEAFDEGESPGEFRRTAYVDF
jgi:hypothetical protein